MPPHASLADQFAAAVREHVAGRLADAEAGYRRILAQDPNSAAAVHGLGVIALQNRRPDTAAELIGRAVSLDPGVAAFRANLGNALKALGRPDAAADAYRQAIAIDPADTVSLNNLGNLLRSQDRLAEAADCYRQGLTHRPDDPVLHNNLGNALAAQGEAAAALASFDQALKLRPDYAEARYNLANLLADQGRLDVAIGEYERALALRPDHLAARNNLGAALRQSNRLAEAIAAHEAVLARDPANPEALSNLGRAFMLQGRIEEAGACYRRALELRPDYREALVNYLLWLNYSDSDAREIFAAHRRWGEMAEATLPPAAPHRNDRNPERRLRVGYVSPDFRTHSIAFYLAPLLAAHDRQAVELFCYADVAQPDAVTRRFHALADHWVPIVGMGAAALADRVRADQIDILVDPAGHGGANLDAFARHPAPVQVAWLGYVNTTGLTAMDYRLVDEITDPTGVADAFASERLVRLAGGFACFEPPADAPEPGAPPCLATGAVTFGSFSIPQKLNDRVLDAWSQILTRTPSSRLLLKAAGFADEGARAQLLRRFAERGVDAERLELVGWVPGLAEHLALYNAIDVALDPFPYNGFTTTCEALWMGLPVVALLGDRHVARVSASFLSRVGLEDLIADELAGYVDLAVQLAAAPERLAELRRTLRPRMAASPIRDAAGFAREVERAYRQMWRDWCVVR